MDYIVVWEFPTTDKNGITADAWVESRHKQLYFCSLYRYHNGRTVKSTKATPINAISDVVIGDDGRYKVRLVKVNPQTALKMFADSLFTEDEMPIRDEFIKFGTVSVDGKKHKSILKVFSKCGFAYNHYVSTDVYEFFIDKTKSLPVSDPIFKKN